MTLAQTVTTCAGIGALIPAYIGLLFWRDPQRAMVQATHRSDQLPMVMVDRYAAFALFAAAAALSGSMPVIAVTFAILAVPGLCDAVIYARAGYPFAKHLAAGVAALFVAVLAGVAAQLSGGL
jgi:hypothetical protein